MKPTELQEMFLAFREQCIWLRCYYNTYSALCKSGDETKELLAASASIFFDNLNAIFSEYSWLQVCEITDPEESMGRKNLAFEHLNATLRDANRMTDEITLFSAGLSRYRELGKGGRNKFISHLGKEAVLKGQAIGEQVQEEVTVFFEILYGYVDAVGNAVDVGPLDFRASAGAGDVIDLIKTLKKCLAIPSSDQPEK
jgi:hypothetical protein